MQIATSPRRVLITAPAAEHPRFQKLFREKLLADWEPIFSEEVAEARFFMQYSSADVWLLHEAAARNGAGEILSAIARADVPTVYLCEPNAESILPAFQIGMLNWLPVSLVWEHPGLLEAGLRNAVHFRRRQRRAETVERQWRRCRRHTDRLVHLIWRTTPVSSPHEWFPQRFALERLHEEVARANRFGEPLSVAIGEVRADASHEKSHLTDWMPKVLGGMKRRCDVIGQYGMNGFLLVMVHTPKMGAVTCCRRLREALEEMNGSGEKESCHAFFGVAEASQQSTPQQLLRQAEENLDVAVRGETDAIIAP